MRDDKKEVISLRKLGKSYSEIKAELKVPKSTLSRWLKPLGWSQNISQALRKQAQKKNTIRIQTLNNIRGERLARAYEEARKEAKQEFEALKYHPLFIAGVMLYWGEGDRATKHAVRLVNIDPHMIRLYVKFLTHVCQIKKDKIQAYLLLYPDLDEETCKNFWIKNAGLGQKNFRKSSVIQGRHKTRRVTNGVCTVVFTSTYLKEKMRIWLDLLPKQLLKGAYYKQKADMV